MDNETKTTKQLTNEIKSLKKQVAELTDQNLKWQQDDLIKRHIDSVLDATKTDLRIMDAELNVVYVAPKQELIYGESHGQKCYKYFRQLDQPCQTCCALKALKTKKVDVAEQVNEDDGTTMQVTSIPFENTLGQWLVAEVYVDVTELSTTKEKLAESQLRLKTIFDNATDGILLINTENAKLSDANQALCEMLGYSYEELTKLTINDIVTDMQLKKMLKSPKKQLTSNKELMIKKKNKTIFYADVNYSTVKIATDKYVLAIFRDVTEKRQLEAEVARYRQRIRDNRNTESLESMGAAIAHELNQPLTVVNLLMAQTIEDLKKKNSQSHIKKRLTDCLVEIKNATAIINKVKDASQKTYSQQTHDINLKILADRIFSVFEETAKNKNIELIDENLKKIPNFKANTPAIEQIFFVIIENAIYEADGKKMTQLKISAKLSQNLLEIVFKDNCGGISPEYIDEIFNPFFTTKSYNHGDGLGLTIAKRILLQRGGNIHAENINKKGAKFKVTLPVNI